MNLHNQIRSGPHFLYVANGTSDRRLSMAKSRINRWRQILSFFNVYSLNYEAFSDEHLTIWPPKWSPSVYLHLWTLYNLSHKSPDFFQISRTLYVWLLSIYRPSLNIAYVFIPMNAHQECRHIDCHCLYAFVITICPDSFQISYMHIVRPANRDWACQTERCHTLSNKTSLQ